MRALNAHDIAALEKFMSDDFTYIDSWREGVTGRDIIIGALRRLIEQDPGFGIEVESYHWREPHVLMSGHVKSSLFGSPRAVWQLTIRDGKVSEYQAWAEGGPPPMSRMLVPDRVTDMAARAYEKPQLGDD